MHADVFMCCVSCCRTSRLVTTLFSSCPLLQLFAASNTDLISSRALGRHLQQIPQEVDGSKSNALAALKAWYVNIYGFCEANSALFAVEHAVDQEGSGFFLRLVGGNTPGEVPGSAGNTAEVDGDVSSGSKLRRQWKKMAPETVDAEKVQQPASSTAAAASAEPHSMKVADLKSLLRGLGLPLAGTKKELLERLADHQRGQMYSWSNRSD
jgi:hypothetical protein